MNDILEYIDSIDTTTYVAECNVICSIMDLYNKESMIMECYLTNDSELYQEGETLDFVKNKSKNDPNKIISALLFIPRLITTFIKSIAKTLKTGKLGQRISVAFKKLAGMKDKEAKEAYCEEVNKRSGGKYKAYVDSKGEIKFRSTGSAIISNAIAVVGLALTVDGMVDALKDAKNLPDIQARIKEINEELKMTSETSGGKSDRLIREKKELRLSEFTTLVDTVSSVSQSVAGLSAAISAKTNEQQFKLQIQGLSDTKRASLMNLIHDTTTKLAAVSGLVSTTIGLAKSVLPFTEKWLIKPSLKADASVDVGRADRAMRTFFKDPTDKDNPKAGLTRKGLEHLYPRGKHEDVNTYSDRLDKIRLDIGYAVRDLILQPNKYGTHISTVFEAYDIDKKVRDLLKVTDLHSDTDMVYVPFEIEVFIPADASPTGELFRKKYNNTFVPALYAALGLFGGNNLLNDGKKMTAIGKSVANETAKANADIIAADKARRETRHENARFNKDKEALLIKKMDEKSEEKS